MKSKIKVLRELMEKYELFQEEDEVGLALKELEDHVEYNIAYGEELIRHLDNRKWDLAVDYINQNNGDIVGYNTKNDIEELFEHITGSLCFRTVTDEELEEINKRL